MPVFVTNNDNTLNVEYLIIAGGGGGGYLRDGGTPSLYWPGGGGGAGGFINTTSTFRLNIQYPVVVGAGGTSGTWPAVPTNGSSSIFATEGASGGGNGGWTTSTTIVAPGNGGSGGGGGATSNNIPPPPCGFGNVPPKNISQGFNGVGGGGGPSGGGGGAGNVGKIGSGTQSPFVASGEGGPGRSTNIAVGTLTSSTSNTIGSGSKTFTITAGLPISVNTWVRVENTITNYMLGRVTSYTGTSLVVDVPAPRGSQDDYPRFGGSGTFTSWTITQVFAGGGSADFNGFSAISIESPGGGGGDANTYSGRVNTGSGGAARTAGGRGTGSPGGSGLIILKIPDTRTATFSGGVTSTLNTALTGFKVYTITATSTTSETVTFS